MKSLLISEEARVIQLLNAVHMFPCKPTEPNAPELKKIPYMATDSYYHIRN